MPVVTGRTLGQAARKIGQRLYRINTGTLLDLTRNPRAFTAARIFEHSMRKLKPSVPTLRAMSLGKKRHYFTKEGWERFGKSAYRRLRVAGFKPQIQRKRVGAAPFSKRLGEPHGPTSRGGYQIDKWQVVAGLGAAGAGLAARRRRRRR